MLPEDSQGKTNEDGLILVKNREGGAGAVSRDADALLRAAAWMSVRGFIRQELQIQN